MGEHPNAYTSLQLLVASTSLRLFQRAWQFYTILLSSSPAEETSNFKPHGHGHLTFESDPNKMFLSCCSMLHCFIASSKMSFLPAPSLQKSKAYVPQQPPSCTLLDPYLHSKKNGQTCYMYSLEMVALLAQGWSTFWSTSIRGMDRGVLLKLTGVCVVIPKKNAFDSTEKRSSTVFIIGFVRKLFTESWGTFHLCKTQFLVHISEKHEKDRQ